MSGKSLQIKDLLVTLLTGLTKGGEPAFAAVLDNAYQKFDGSPVAQVLPGKLGMSRVTTHQVDKVPMYIVRISVDAENTPEGQQAVFNALYDLSDIVIDAIADADQQNTLDSIGVYMLDAQLGDWAPFTTNAGIQLVFDIDVSVSYSRALG